MARDVKKDCVVAILSWNTVDITPNAIDSLLKQTKRPTVLIIDNGSIDGTYEVLKERYGEKIEIVRNKKNLGFSGGANVAIEWAKKRSFKYLGLLNSDAVADERWVEELIKTIKTNEKVGIATSKILKLDGKEIDTTGEEFFYWGLSSPRGRGELDKGQYDKPERVFGGSGGASMYSMEMIRQIGGFDKNFFAYYEDADLSFRANLTGWEVHYNPEATVRHEIGLSSSKVGGMTRQMGIKNQPMLILKNVPLRYLPGVSSRFFFLWLGNISSALKDGQYAPLLKALIKLIFFMPKKFLQRLKIQHLRRKKGVKSRDIGSLMSAGLPGQVSSFGSVRLAKKIFFWDKS
jgi:GT2 family glycosyltransferase